MEVDIARIEWNEDWNYVTWSIGMGHIPVGHPRMPLWDACSVAASKWRCHSSGWGHRNSWEDDSWMKKILIISWVRFWWLDNWVKVAKLNYIMWNWYRVKRFTSPLLTCIHVCKCTSPNLNKGTYSKSGNFRCKNIFVVDGGYEN